MQVLAFTEHFGMSDDDPRVNVWGGAIATGHPLAASGVRLMSQLARQFEEHPEVRYGLTTMCVGLGMGGTVIWENPHFTGPTQKRAAGDEGPPPTPRSEPDVTTTAPPPTSPAGADSAALPVPVLPDEVVTEAHLRLLDVPGVAGKVALITLDNGKDHTRPSTFGPQGLLSLDAALDGAFAAAPAAIAVTGKPFVFAVGADLSGIGALADKVTGRAFGALGHKVFRRLRESQIPTFAFVNGAALGGGVEIALHCHYRTLAANAAMMALPECFLGILPGWGGTQLLPKIAGPESAVTVIIENALNQNRMLKPGAGRRTGRRRRGAGFGRLPGAVIGLAGGRTQRRHHRGAPGILRGRLRRGARARPDDRRHAHPRRRAGAVPGP